MRFHSDEKSDHKEAVRLGIGLIPPYAAAEFLGERTKTLRQWRFDEVGPKFFCIAGRISYSVGELIEFRDQRAALANAGTNVRRPR